MTPSPACILIVEDHDDSRLMLQLVLRSEGFSVVGAADCEDALLQAQDTRFDLCILDHCLPGGDVAQLRRDLRELHPAMPVLYYTGTTYSAAEIEELRKVGDDYLVKPAEIKTMLATVGSLLPASEA